MQWFMCVQKLQGALRCLKYCASSEYCMRGAMRCLKYCASSEYCMREPCLLGAAWGLGGVIVSQEHEGQLAVIEVEECKRSQVGEGLFVVIATINFRRLDLVGHDRCHHKGQTIA
eukprot:1156876-Pelagomonas_calceolata.AAC.20